MNRAKRTPLVAVLLSIVTPGLGQVYNGQLRKGIVCYLICNLAPVFLALIGLQYQFHGMLGLLALTIVIYLYVAGDALFVARKIKEAVLEPYNKWYYYLLIAILSVGISASTDGIVKRKIFGIKAYKIPVGSMVPSLLAGDHLVVDLNTYKNEIPRRGDIVVFKYPLDTERDFIKRIVGVPGDVIGSVDKVLSVNGNVIDEPYVRHVDDSIKLREIEPRDNFGPITIPEGKFFVMGDNRDYSYDSRYWGFVNRDLIRGKALYIYWSDKMDRVGLPIR